MYCKKFVPQLIALVLTTSLNACGNSQQQPTKLLSSEPLNALHRKLISLTPGEYLVKITKQSKCAVTNLSVAQHWEYPDPNEKVNPVIELRTVSQGNMESSQSPSCTPGVSTGWTIVKMEQNGALTYDWDSGEIATVDLIETKLTRETTSAVTLEPRSAFIVDSEIESSCRDQMATLESRFEPALSQDNASTTDKMLFTSILPVTDNLFHKAICRTPTFYHASEYVETSANKMSVTAAGQIKTIKTLRVRAISKRTSVFPAQSTKTIDIEITNTDGARLMTALENLGVVDVDPMIGATNLMITNLRCQKNSSNNPTTATCSYTFTTAEDRSQQTAQGVTGVDAETLFDVLQIHGASLPAGINPRYQAVGAKKVLCSRPVVPDPVATCVISL